MIPWPHQERAIVSSRELYKQKYHSWCIVAPCGAGKSLIMRRLAAASQSDKIVFIYTHRVLLTQQTIRTLEADGIEFGVFAAGFKQHHRPDAKVQICSLDTVASRMDSWKYDLPNPDIVIVDEAHQQVASTAQEVFGQHRKQGAKLIGFTATPVGLQDIGYQHLVNAGTYSEMLQRQAHLPIHCYGPDRPDLSKLKATRSGEFSDADNRKLHNVPTIIGRVYEYWQKLNPGALPAIGFAPGVAESQWFVDEFRKKGIPCAHIDAERVVMVERGLNGILQTRELTASEETRQAVLEGSKAGQFKIVWNRFVLREAIDMPWLYQAIAATSMGALSTYLQSIGRVQRYWSAYDHVLLQDHGGNIDRHGPPDIDRHWELGCTNNSMNKAEQQRRQKTQGEDAEPICCPKCCGYRTHGQECPHCGYMHNRSVRMVRQLDGELTQQTGRQTKFAKPKSFDDFLRSAMFAGYCVGQTVRQAYFIASKKAREAGVAEEAVRIFLPKPGSDQWNRSVREIYPWARPKHLKGVA